MATTDGKNSPSRLSFDEFTRGLEWLKKTNNWKKIHDLTLDETCDELRAALGRDLFTDRNLYRMLGVLKREYPGLPNPPEDDFENVPAGVIEKPEVKYVLTHNGKSRYIESGGPMTQYFARNFLRLIKIVEILVQIIGVDIPPHILIQVNELSNIAKNHNYTDKFYGQGMFPPDENHDADTEVAENMKIAEKRHKKHTGN